MVVKIEPAAVVGTGSIRVVAVPGWMGDHRLFQPMIPFIDTSRYSFAVLNARGYGNRLQAGGPYTIDQIASDIVACANGMGWDSFHVVGHSMAGMAAQRLLVDAPDRIFSAILIAPVPASGVTLTDERRSLLLQATRDPMTRKKLIDANTGNVRPDAWLSELRDASLAGTRPDALAEYMASWGGPGFAHELTSVGVPVRVLVGELDPGANTRMLQERLAGWFPDFELAVLQGCGHYPMWEMSAECMRTMDQWLLH